MPLNRWTPGPCNCDCGACSYTFFVTGCHDLPLNAAVVDVYEDDTKAVLVATGATDSTGEAALSLPGPGDYFVSVSGYGFSGANEDWATLACDGWSSYSLGDDLIEPGRQPIANCATPFPLTVNFTFVHGDIEFSGEAVREDEIGGGWPWLSEMNDSFGVCDVWPELRILLDTNPSPGPAFYTEWWDSGTENSGGGMTVFGTTLTSSISGPAPSTSYAGTSPGGAPQPENDCRPSTPWTMTITE